MTDMAENHRTASTAATATAEPDGSAGGAFGRTVYAGQ